MLKQRYLFPIVYAIFLIPVVIGSPVTCRVLVFATCAVLAFLINTRTILNIIALLATSLCTLIPFLLIVQGAVCSSSGSPISSPLLDCVIERSLAVLLSVGLLTSVLLLAVANEWQGSVVGTVNRMSLPRDVRLMVVVAGAMIGEFRRAVIRVHHAFTARGDALPSVNWRNVTVLPSMLGSVWASVLNGAAERLKGHWSSDTFWARYVPVRQRLQRSPGTGYSDIAVLAAAGLVIFLLLERVRW